MQSLSTKLPPIKMVAKAPLHNVQSTSVDPTAVKDQFDGEVVEKVKAKVPEERRERDLSESQVVIVYDGDVPGKSQSPRGVEGQQQRDRQPPPPTHCRVISLDHVQQPPSVSQFLDEVSNDPEVPGLQQPTFEWKNPAISEDVFVGESESYVSSNHNGLTPGGMDMYDDEPPQSVTPDATGSRFDV